MLVVRIHTPYVPEHFGGEDGVVDWGRNGENVVWFDNESNNAHSIRIRPDLYRVINLPEHLQDAVNSYDAKVAKVRTGVRDAVIRAKAKADAAEVKRIEEERLDALAREQVNADRLAAEKAERDEAEAKALAEIKATEAEKSETEEAETSSESDTDLLNTLIENGEVGVKKAGWYEYKGKNYRKNKLLELLNKG